jgi:hypothetical protein
MAFLAAIPAMLGTAASAVGSAIYTGAAAVGSAIGSAATAVGTSLGIGGTAAAGTAAAGIGAGTALSVGTTALTGLALLNQAAQIGTGVAGTALSIAGTQAQVQQEYAAHDVNANVAKMESEKLVDMATENARRRRRESDSFVGSQIAKLGATGVDFLGSPLDVVFGAAERGELAARDIEYEGYSAAAGRNYEAKIHKYRRDQVVPMGQIKIAGQALQGASTLFGQTLGTR